MEKGVLTIYVPVRTIHTKLFILENTGAVRVIQTSANLTETAQKAKRQINYAWYLDLPIGETALNKVLEDYETHRDYLHFVHGRPEKSDWSAPGPG